MQPESILSDWRERGLAGRLPDGWRIPLGSLAIAWLALIVLATREWGEILHQWWNIDTYNHILLIPLIIAWLVALRRDDLARIEPKAWLPGLALVLGALTLWLIGRATGINLVAHAGAVAALQAAVVAVLGLRTSAILFLPLTFMVFLVPFGDELIPALQMITADIAITLTHWSGVRAAIDGIFIDTPVGLFIVAEACSGVKFLVAMVALGTLVCFTAFESWTRRALFMLACVIVPILANGVRAWGTIYIAQSQGVEFAEGFDHIFYGWIFFAIVVAILLGAAWHFIEREPEDAGWSLDQIDAQALVSKAEKRPIRATKALGAILALVLIFALAAIYATGALI